MKSIYPVLCSKDVAAARDFYVALLGFEIVFDADWYVQLQSPSDPTTQLGLVARDHGSVPEQARQHPAGVFVTVEVEDVDAVHARAQQLALPIAYALRDEPWGQRHFMTPDPDGLLVDVVKMIPPAADFAADGTVA